MDEQSVIHVAAPEKTADLEGGGMVVQKDGVAYGLNPVGRRIWELVQQPVRVDAVRDTLLQEYDVGAERCTQELLALLDDLALRGLVKLENG